MGHNPVQLITALSVGLAIEEDVLPNILLQRTSARHYRIREPRQYVAKFDAILQGLQCLIALRDWVVTGAVL